jgi:CheY-like chemotaxis protein
MRENSKILIIDDDKFFLEFYRAEFAQLNLTTDFAKDGEDGLQKILELQPDVVLLDLMLPKKDGFAVLREMRANDQTKKIPVVVVTSLNAPLALKQLEGLEVQKIFNKLFSLPKEVVEYVCELLDRENGRVAETGKSVEKKGSYLSKATLEQIFKGSLTEIELAFERIFSQKAQIEDYNMALIPPSEFKKNIIDLTRQPGAVFLFAPIKAVVAGAALMAMRRSDVLTMIKLIQESALGKNLELNTDDRVVEEFFNMIINSFLTKLSSSMTGPVLLQTPVFVNEKEVVDELAKIDAFDLKDSSVMFIEESYSFKDLDLDIAIYITFGSELFTKLR